MPNIICRLSNNFCSASFGICLVSGMLGNIIVSVQKIGSLFENSVL